MKSLIFLWYFCEFWDSGEHLLPFGPVKVPFRSVCCGDEPVCALLKCAFFVFCRIFCVFTGRFEHGRFSCKGGREMAGIVPTVFAASCGRSTALSISQPSLLSFFYPFHLSPPLLSFFSNCHSFHPFSLFPSLFSFFSTMFQQFSFTFCHFPPFLPFFGQSDASPCNPLVSNVLHEAQDTETNAACCERGFCMFLCIFRHIQKRRPNSVKSKKKEGL